MIAGGDWSPEGRNLVVLVAVVFLVHVEVLFFSIGFSAEERHLCYYSPAILSRVRSWRSGCKKASIWKGNGNGNSYKSMKNMSKRSLNPSYFFSVHLPRRGRFRHILRAYIHTPTNILRTHSTSAPKHQNMYKHEPQIQFCSSSTSAYYTPKAVSNYAQPCQIIEPSIHANSKL